MREKILTGDILKFGDQIDTDVIAPSRWHREGLEVLSRHTMEAIRPAFYKNVVPGDIIVAGKNFGCGSHREPATTIMKHLGIAAIVADSVARLYYRSCISFGIPIFSVEGISRVFEEGDKMELVMNKAGACFKNLTRGGELSSPPLPGTMAEVLEAGGIYALMRRRLGETAD